MADSQENLSDADKIRLKRLARLGGPSVTPARVTPAEEVIAESTAAGAAESSRSAPVSAASRLLATPTPAQAPSPSTEPQAASASVTPQASTSASRGAHEDASKRSNSFLGKRPAPLPVEEPTGPRVVTSANAQLITPKTDYSTWETDSVGRIFSVTLSRQSAEQSDWNLCWLKELSTELAEEDPAATSKQRTTLQLADRLLIARLSLDPSAMRSSDDPETLMILAGLPENETIFEYLTGCWRRLNSAQRELNRLAFTAADKDAWSGAFTKLKSLIISYSGMTLEDPTMFPQPPDKLTGPAEFLPILLEVNPSGSDLPAGDLLTGSTLPSGKKQLPLSAAELPPFLSDLAAGFADEDGGLANVLVPTLSLFFQEWFKLQPTPDLMGSEWRRYIGAVSVLTRVKSIAATLPSLSIWAAPGVTAPKIEWQSLLGPLTRLSVYPREFPEIWKSYFANPTERKVADIDANKANLRHTLNGLQTNLFDIYNSIIRSNPDSREKVLDFFSLVLHLNQKRSGTHVDHRTVSSDGYMTNLQAVLLKLFAPVMDATYSKIDRVDHQYFRNSRRLDITEETKIRATKEESDEYYKEGMDVDGPPNFITDLFFLLNAFQHLGISKTIGTRAKAEKNMTEIERELKRLEATRSAWEGNPRSKAEAEAAIAKYKNDIATLHASIHAYDTQLLDPTLRRANVTFLSFLMTWLIRLVDPDHQYPAAPLKLPLPQEAPMSFRMLPEYLFDNIAEYFEFLARYEGDPFDNSEKDSLITFVITFLSPGYINNPFLKAKLVAILSYGLYPMGHYRKGPLYDRLSLHPLSTQYLMPGLIRFYIDVESTGGHTQFWDKFNFRRDMGHIFKSLWDNPLHRQAFVQTRHDDLDQFIRFINMLMSDTTFHLNESVENLAKIHAIESQKADSESWEALPQSERQDLESQLRQAEQQAPWETRSGLDNVELIRDFTATTKEPFVTGEIVDRLAASLDETLVGMVGPKMQELKISDPDKYYFKPKRLLAGLAQIYLNLSTETDFIRAVANDGRSYSKEIFEKFARILKNRAIMTELEVREVIAFTQKIEDMKATIAMEDEREIPDEFLDPLLSTLMKDPVILPVSRQTVDRSTIRTVLLSGDKDPFNNVPLKLEDCVPDIELKAKIDAWVAEGKTGQAAQVMDVDKL